MAIPYRGRTGLYTYFVTANCLDKRRLLQSVRSANLLIEVFASYRASGHYQLHEFVVMPDHFHAILTPTTASTLEKCLQLIKGGFSYRAKRELQRNFSTWQSSFHDRRLRDWKEYATYREYIHHNPVKAGFYMRVGEWPFSSATGKFEIDPVPQGLKPPTSFE
jgi:putative transposase